MSMRMCAAVAAASLLGGAAQAAESWAFDLETTGDDVFWMSPTNVDPGAPRYDGVFTIGQVIVDVDWIVPIADVDVTDSVPPELQVTPFSLRGPAPIDFGVASIVFPEPPEAPGLTADIDTNIDASGFGMLAITNVFLGDVDVDLGGIFGVQTVTVTRVQVIGTLDLCANFCPADLTMEGMVDAADLGQLLGAWGVCPAGGFCESDFDGDGIVGPSDLGNMLGSWGACE